MTQTVQSTDLVSMQYRAGDEKNERLIRQRFLQARWFGGEVKFGKEPHQVSPTYQAMRKVSPEIVCRWVEGEPVQGHPATLEAVIDGETKHYLIEPNYPVYGGDFRPRPVSTYKKLAEDWMLWKWHTARGTPVDTDAREATYLVEPGFQPPAFLWENEANVIVKKK